LVKYERRPLGMCVTCPWMMVPVVQRTRTRTTKES
jgi:hypothetical protein